jgi:hypothetical protein
VLVLLEDASDLEVQARGADRVLRQGELAAEIVEQPVDRLGVGERGLGDLVGAEDRDGVPRPQRRRARRRRPALLGGDDAEAVERRAALADDHRRGAVGRGGWARGRGRGAAVDARLLRLDRARAGVTQHRALAAVGVGLVLVVVVARARWRRRLDSETVGVLEHAGGTLAGVAVPRLVLAGDQAQLGRLLRPELGGEAGEPFALELVARARRTGRTGRAAANDSPGCGRGRGRGLRLGRGER